MEEMEGSAYRTNLCRPLFPQMKQPSRCMTALNRRAVVQGMQRGERSCGWVLFAFDKLWLRLPVPAQGSTAHPGSCALPAAFLKKLPWAFIGVGYLPMLLTLPPASLPALPGAGKAPVLQPAAYASRCVSQHPCPRASLNPCERCVLKVTVRRREELI